MEVSINHQAKIEINNRFKTDPRNLKMTNQISSLLEYMEYLVNFINLKFIFKIFLIFYLLF